MQTQINCPQCQMPFPTQIVQIVDAQRQPELKQMLLSGSLNVAVCPHCGAATQLGTPLLFHDADHELLMVHVPMELNLPLPEQERLVGQLTKVITDNTPPDQFRGYMLQPQVILTMQTFMEKVYETEGITPEMMARQQDQAQLLQQFIMSDRATVDQLITEQEDLIDETFFALLSQSMQVAEQNPQANQQFIQLANLQAKLFTKTEIGRRLERQQGMLTLFQKEAQQQGGLSTELLLKHLLLNLEDDAILGALIQMGQQALRYELFSRLTEEIESTEAGPRRENMERLHANLLSIYEEMQSQAKELFDKANNLLDILMHSPNVGTAVERNLDKIDESFMQFLESQIQQAEQNNDKKRLARLQPVQKEIMKHVQDQMPAELQLLNQLLSTDDAALQRQILNQLPPDLRPQFGQMLDMMAGEMATNDPALAERIQRLRNLVN